MDHQQTCAVKTKTGHIAGQRCGKVHWSKVHVFEPSRSNRCFAWPKCLSKLAKMPSHTKGTNHRVFGKYVVIAEGGF